MDASSFKTWLFTPHKEPHSVWDIIRWWEARRFAYNLFVGVVGLCSLVAFYYFILTSGELKEGEDAVEPLALAVAPFAVNICYTAGWIVEILASRTKLDVGRPLGPLLLRLGMNFSLFVILLPTLLWAMIWLKRLIAQ